MIGLVSWMPILLSPSHSFLSHHATLLLNIVRGGALRDEKRLRGRLPILLQLSKSESSINNQTTQKRLWKLTNLERALKDRFLGEIFCGGKHDCLIMECPIITTGLDLSLLCCLGVLESCCYRLVYGLIDYSRLGCDCFCSFVDSVAANSDCRLSFLFQQKTRGTLLWKKSFINKW